MFGASAMDFLRQKFRAREINALASPPQTPELGMAWHDLTWRPSADMHHPVLHYEYHSALSNNHYHPPHMWTVG